MGKLRPEKARAGSGSQQGGWLSQARPSPLAVHRHLPYVRVLLSAGSWALRAGLLSAEATGSESHPKVSSSLHADRAEMLPSRPFSPSCPLLLPSPDVLLGRPH